ncbi:hypothetical protein CKAH01_10697 [Colletotrichum kahawae]|uniref:Uncharacterized protein n=1 Tax=Colletotrichum kahawae TaxID=34407 RepID=A0AAD9XVI1_COLKA|nr:hypothetical protein CKAH01_10697 [Colletotrichum kahawae]
MDQLPAATTHRLQHPLRHFPLRSTLFRELIVLVQSEKQNRLAQNHRREGPRVLSAQQRRGPRSSHHRRAQEGGRSKKRVRFRKRHRL